jgi:polar amino acid transport system permease protein
MPNSGSDVGFGIPGIEVLLNGAHWLRLMEGLAVTLKVAFLSIAISAVLGILFGLLRTLPNGLLRGCFRIYLECVRVIPQLVWLYLLYYVLAADFQINLSGQLVGILAFSFWGAAEMSDIVRGALTAVPRHQGEAALALGLDRWQKFRHVLLPQAWPMILPASINLAARMIMTTSLLFTLGVVEIIKVGQQIIESSGLRNPLAAVWIYGLIFLIYFALCFPLSLYARKLFRAAGNAAPLHI